MPRILFILLFSLLHTCILQAQEQPATSSIEQLVDRLSRFSNAVPQEKVYLHMDNTCYFLGDTIWFAAYSRQTNNGKPSTLSRVLYVELYNQDGYMMERQLIELINGRGNGNFVLSKQNYAGYYELRAYTRWQLNWGRTEHKHSSVSKLWFLNEELQSLYYRDYDKLYSRVFPVYDAPQHEGEYAENMTLRPMRRQFKNDPSKRKLQLTAYPEGGNLIAGLPCRVAYEATWDDGQEAEGTLQGFDAPTLNRGRGIFEFTPEKDASREIVFTTADGKTVSAKLPKPEDEGVALKAIETPTGWHFHIQLSPTLSPGSLGLTIMHEGNLLDALTIDRSKVTIDIPFEKLREGVNQLTIFDANGRVWADRLFMVLPHGEAQNGQERLVAEGVKPMYEPYEKVKFQLTSNQPDALISLAIRDAAHSDLLYDNATLRTEMLLSSEIKGFVPNPQWFFEHDDEEHRQALDLLMMTQGWRRFNWRHMAVRGEWDLTEVAEKAPVIRGKVYNNPTYLDQRYTDEEFVSIVKGDGIYNRHNDQDIEFGTNNLATDDGGGEAASEGSAEAEVDIPDDPDALPDNQRLIYEKNLEGRKRKNDKEQLVHIELVSADGKESRQYEMMTQHNQFQMMLPGYYGQAVLFISASDSTKWKKGHPHTWIQMASDKESPEFAVRLNEPYPRFVKPYHYYQQNLLETSDSLLKLMKLDDGTTQMNEVRIGAKRTRMQKFSDSIPAFIVDAYVAYNHAIDAGMLTPSLSTPESMGLEGIVRSYVGDYGMEFPYIHISIPFGGYVTHSNIEQRFAYDQTRRSLEGFTLNTDSAYLRGNLISFKPFAPWGEMYRNMAPAAMRKMYQRTAQDKYVVYTDYQPRLEGDDRYKADNLPNTQIAIYLYPDDSERVIYRDRRYVFNGYAYPDDFYQPDYSQRRLDERPKDYRRTLYWNPSLQLDKKGQADIEFYHNGKPGQLSISAEGITPSGTILEN